MVFAIVKKEAQVEPSPLPTPSPSPLSHSHPLPTRKCATPRRAQPAPLPQSTSVTPSDAQIAHDLAYARRCAERMRLMHVAKAVYPSPSTTASFSSNDDHSVRMSRYHIDLERTEGNQKMVRRISVIIPGDISMMKRERSTPHPVPSRKQRPLPRLTFLPPPSFLPPLSSPRGSQFPASSTRRLSLPSLRSLSLLPPPAPAPPYRSPAPSSSSTTSTPRGPLVPLVPSLLPLQDPALSSQLLQRRRAALTLRHSPPLQAIAEHTPGRRPKRRLSCIDAGDEPSLAGTTQTKGSLGARRGKAVEPLVLV
ncbi:hypothetical protein JCM21900_006285 [Sporobolomyces salmonicolor]